MTVSIDKFTQPNAPKSTSECLALFQRDAHKNVPPRSNNMVGVETDGTQGMLFNAVSVCLCIGWHSHVIIYSRAEGCESCAAKSCCLGPCFCAKYAASNAARGYTIFEIVFSPVLS